MRIDLHEIINVPGGSASFDYEPDLENLYPGAVLKELEKARAKGVIRNSAGVLKLEAVLTAKLRCACDRCAAEYDYDMRLPISAVLTEEQNDEENTDLYLLDGDYADLDEIINTAYVLEMGTKFLCKEDCAGLCPKCGKNLNDGPCSCKADMNPKLAVLQQLLTDK
jgi:uncharacterized protein